MLINSIRQNTTITNKPRQNFDGKFFAITDTHGRTIKAAGLLTAIEKRCADEIPATLLDCGDFAHGSYSIEAITGVYTKFAQLNKHIKTIINMGNCEIFDLKNNLSKFKQYEKAITESGIQFISAAKDFLSKKTGTFIEHVKPYTIVEDIVNGKNKKVLITGITSASDNNIMTLQEQKESLKEILPIAIKEHSPDKIILMSHNYLPDTKEIVDYLKTDLKIENLDLVIGGHPHSLEDETYNATRLLYAPVQGKAALEIEHTDKGFEFPEMKINRVDKYDYDIVGENSENVIKNHIIGKNLEINPIYQQIMDTLDSNSMNKKITTMVTNLAYRKAGKQVSETSELGTFLANAIKKETNSDLSLIISMDIREELPKKGNPVTLYNVKDTLNASKPIYIINAEAKQIVEMFEISLNKQNQKNVNSDFFEFSDNLKLERFVNKTPDENKVKQLYIKDENNAWQALIDEKTQQIKPEFENNKFKIAVCEFMAKGKRKALEKFKEYPSELYLKKGQQLSTEEVLIKALQEIENKPDFKLGRSEIIDFE